MAYIYQGFFINEKIDLIIKDNPEINFMYIILVIKNAKLQKMTLNMADLNLK